MIRIDLSIELYIRNKDCLFVSLLSFISYKFNLYENNVFHIRQIVLYCSQVGDIRDQKRAVSTENSSAYW